MSVVSNCKRVNFPTDRLERCIFFYKINKSSLAFALFHGVFCIQSMFHRSHKFGEPDSVKVLVKFLCHKRSSKPYSTTVFLHVNVTFFVCLQQTTEPQSKFSETVLLKIGPKSSSIFFLISYC